MTDTEEKSHEVCALIDDATSPGAFVTIIEAGMSKDTLDYTRATTYRRDGKIFTLYVSATVRVECKGEDAVPG